MTESISKWIMLFACFLLLAGCVARKSPDVTYFSLLTMEQMGEVQALSSHPDLQLGIGPVTITDNLKRSQIVTRQHGNQYTFDEFNRWAGVLEQDVATVVGDNLGVLLGVEKIDFFPWMNYFVPTYRITIDIQRLDGSLGGEALLDARWAIADASGKALLAAGKTVLRKNVDDSEYAALIRAESLLIADLSKKIAAELNSLLIEP